MASRVTRPRAHFTPETGWINDPLGLTLVEGRYHLFFQHVPDSTEWAPHCHWGHAVSDDLVTWEARPIALAPGDGDDGAWSGSITVDAEGGALLYYTSVEVPEFGIGRVRVARPADDSWDHWDKGEVVVELPEQLDAVAFRDPFVFRDGGGWRMLVGTSLRGGTAAAASFSSDDRISWTYDGLAAERSGEQVDPVWTGSLWECPQIFEIDGAQVLVTSVWEDDVLHYVAYAVGLYEDGRFVARQWHRLTYGDSYYAPSFFRDRDGLPGLIFWLRGPLDEDSGWASALSVPHRLRLVDDRLVTESHPEALARISALGSDGGEGSPQLVHWDPAVSDVHVHSGEGSPVVLRQRGEGIEIHEDGESKHLLAAPSAPVLLLLDGPVLEVFLGTSSYAIGARSDLSVHLVDTTPTKKS